MRLLLSTAGAYPGVVTLVAVVWLEASGGGVSSVSAVHGMKIWWVAPPYIQLYRITALNSKTNQKAWVRKSACNWLTWITNHRCLRRSSLQEGHIRSRFLQKICQFMLSCQRKSTISSSIDRWLMKYASFNCPFLSPLISKYDISIYIEIRYISLPSPHSYRNDIYRKYHHENGDKW